MPSARLAQQKENCRCPDSFINNPGVQGLYCIHSHATPFWVGASPSVRNYLLADKRRYIGFKCRNS